MDKCIARISYFNEKIAFFDPIQIYNEKKDTLEPVCMYKNELFPPNGRIFYPRKDRDNDLDYYSYVKCEYEENPIPPADSRHDKILATTFIPLRLVYYPCVEQK